jgi:ABC-2 type transport system ATP-binding protein
VNALDVTGLSHSFGRRQALSDVSFSLQPGGFTALLGLNGAGKTTLLSLITRLYHARQGTVRVLGRDLRREPEAALALMGVVFQEPTLDPDLSVRENLRYHGALYGLDAGESARRSCEELERAGLAGRLSDTVRILSGGQRRRVELARALIHRPRLLVLDEPTSGLDPASRRDLLRHVRELRQRDGLSVLWATHLVDEVEAGDGLVLLHRGRVLHSGPAGDFAPDGHLERAFLAVTERAA